MRQRIISGLIIACLFTLAFLVNNVVFKLLLGVISILAYKEIVNLPKIKDNLNIPIKILGLLSLLLIIFLNKDGYSLYLGVSYASLSFLMISLLFPMLFSKKYNSDVAFKMIGLIILLGLSLNSLLTIFISNKYLLLYIILLVCSNDIFAYFVGSFIGKTKFTKISPKKTIEGSVGGLVCACIISSFYYLAVFSNSNVIKVILISIILSIASQIGDLVFSKIKRDNNIKDFSNLIPGHGGVLDRLDSTLITILFYVILSSVL